LIEVYHPWAAYRPWKL